MKRTQLATQPTIQSPMRRKVANVTTVTETQTTTVSPLGYLADLSKLLDPWAPGGFYFYFILTGVIVFVLTLGLTVNVIEVVFNISVIAIMMASLAACYMVYKS